MAAAPLLLDRNREANAAHRLRPIPIQEVNDLIALARVLYRAVRQSGDARYLLPRIAQIGTQLKFALSNGKERAGSTGLTMAWRELEQALSRMNDICTELKPYGGLTVGGLISALGFEIRKRQQFHGPSDREEKRKAEQLRR